MADPVAKTFTTIVQGEVAAVQARAQGLADLTIGSVLRAVLEAFAGVVLWLQGLILVLLRTTRLATSPDADADSFVADFGAAPLPGDPTLFERLPASFAGGLLTFTRFSTTGTATVLVGQTVSTLDGSQKFTVLLDTANPAYDPVAVGYTMVAGIGTLNLKARALTAGSAGNAAAGAVNTITSAIVGVDTVTNAAAFSGGFDQETTAAMNVRFRQMIAALMKGTPLALRFAIASLQRGVTAIVVENTHFDGTTEKGFSTILVDDGSGFPSSDLLTAAGVAADEVHAAGTSFACYAPVVTTINVSAVLVTTSTSTHTNVVALAIAALNAFLNSLPIASPVYWSRVWQVLQDSSPDVLEVTGLTVNSGTADIVLSFKGVAKSGTLAIT